MKVELLRDRLLSVLPNQLGTYTLEGQSTPAIAILSTGQSLPNDRAVKGLELIIRREPESKIQAMYGASLTIKTWTIYLSQWEGEYTLRDAIAEISTQFPAIKMRLVQINEQKGIREQFELKITDFDGD